MPIFNPPICAEENSPAPIHNCSLQKAQLQLMNVASGKVITTDMAHASPRLANLSGANLQQVNFRDADLGDASLVGTNMTGARR
jgi:uncharacterized protein YjbI with pentapeptide repeats